MGTHKQINIRANYPDGHFEYVSFCSCYLYCGGTIYTYSRGELIVSIEEISEDHTEIWVEIKMKKDDNDCWIDV